MKANHNRQPEGQAKDAVVSKIVEKKNESKSQLNTGAIGTYNVVSKIVEKKNESKSQLWQQEYVNTLGCVKDRWEKEWKQITTKRIRCFQFCQLCQRSLRKRMKANHNMASSMWRMNNVVSKIVEKKNESKSQRGVFLVDEIDGCVKDRWEKEWKQITTLGNVFPPSVGCVKDRWEKEWKQITTAHGIGFVECELCQRSLRKRMKANHNYAVLLFPAFVVVSKIVEKKNESKSQPTFVELFGQPSCVKDRWEKEWKQITTAAGVEELSSELCQRSLRKRMKANHNCRKWYKMQYPVVSKIVEKKNESKSQHHRLRLVVN